MKNKGLDVRLLLVSIPVLLVVVACDSAHGGPAAEAPPAATVLADVNVGLFFVAHPQQDPVVAPPPYSTVHKLMVTGTVNPDIARNVPVISLATGRVVAIHARLGDTVKKGQLLLSIRSDDVASSFADYRKAMADESLARTQRDRATGLYEHGAIS